MNHLGAHIPNNRLFNFDPVPARYGPKSDLMRFIEELRSANVPLIGLLGFAQGRRIQILIITKDENESAVRTFLKSQGILAKRGRLSFEDEPRGITQLGQLEMWAASAADMRMFADFPASPTSRRRAGFMFVEHWID